jgi:hypothetical protein
VVIAHGLEEAPVAGVADQRIVAAAQLPLQRGEDRGAIGGILRRLLVVDADDVAPPKHDRFGTVFGISAARLDDERHEGRGVVQHDIAH